MIRCKNILLYSLCVLFIGHIQDSYSQKIVSKLDNLKPMWLTHGAPKPSNNSFEYQITESELPTLNEAQSGCFVTLSSYVERRDNIQIRSVNDMGVNANGESQSEYLRQDFRYTINGEVRHITSRKYDEYWECVKYPTGEVKYRCYSLFAVAKEQNVAFDDLQFTQKYGGRGLWRSMIVPGWGQFYKGSKVKGSIMLSGTVALAGVALFSEGKRSNYARNMAESYSSDTKRYYADKANSMSNIRNICAGGAIVLYIYNLIDAVVASGAKRIKITKQGSPKSAFTLTPNIGANTHGASVAYTF